MVISCTFLFVAFWISGCRSLVSGLFLASKMNSCGCHDMMANLSQSERKRDDRRLSQWAAAYLHIWHKYFYGPRLKTNTLLWSWSRGLSVNWRLLVEKAFGQTYSTFYFLLIYFFAFPALPNDIKVSSASVESWYREMPKQVMLKTAICSETEAGIRGQDVFLRVPHYWEQNWAVEWAKYLEVTCWKYTFESRGGICAEASGLFRPIHSESLWKWMNHHFGRNEHFLPELLQISWCFVIF